MILRNVSYINSIDEKLFSESLIHIKNGIIEDIISSDEDVKIDSEHSLDLTGYTLLPGFINAHSHTGFKQLGGVIFNDFHLSYLEKSLNEGVTTIRDEGMFSDFEIDNYVKRKQEISKSDMYPTIIGVGKFFSAKGGYGGTSPIGIDNIQELNVSFDKALADGIDMVKTVLEDGLDESTFGLPKLSEEMLKELCDLAHANNLRVSAHVTQSHNLEKLINAGIDDAAHMVYDFLSDELIKQMVKKKIAVVPTLTFYKMIKDKFQAPLLEIAKDNLIRFVKAGGLVGVGDDFIEEELPWYRLGLPRMELELLKEAGLTNFQIIQALTINGSIICGVYKIVGTIEKGKKADLVIVKGNPLENINYLFDVAMVIKNGKIVIDNT